MMLKNKRFLVALSLCLLLVSVFAVPAFADLTVSPNSNGLCVDLKTAANNFANFLQQIVGFISAIAFIIGGALMLWSGGNSKRLMVAKILFGVTLAGVAVIFEADKIASWWLGVGNFQYKGC